MSRAEQSPSIDEVRRMVSRMLDGLNQNASISAIVLFQVSPEKEETFVHDLRELTAGTRRLPGVVVFTFHKRQPWGWADGAPPEFLIYEEWKTTRHFRAQWDSQHLKRFQHGVGELVLAPPDLRFYYGSEVVPGRAGTTPVLATGQRRCWDAEGIPIECAGTGQDGAVRAGVPFASRRYTDNRDGTVTDNRTGLVWLKDANAFGEVPWAEAVTKAREVADGDYGLGDGSKPGDWRLPNVNELQSLVDLDSAHGPAFPDAHPFVNLEAANYWSSSSVAASPALGWFIAFAVGPPVFDLKINSMRMWPVRGGAERRVAQTGLRRCFDPSDPSGQTPIPCEGTGQDGEFQAGATHPEPRFTDLGDGTVADNLNGLIWLHDADFFGVRDWQSALDACNTLAAGTAGLQDGSTAGDWRLPNVHELRSLVDYGQAAPALTPGHPFRNARPSLYWSSTTVSSAPNQARFVFIGLGPSVWDHKSVLLHVWPVRGGVGGGGDGSTDRRRAAMALAAS